MSAALTQPLSPAAEQPAGLARGHPPDDFGGVLGGPTLYECAPAG